MPALTISTNDPASSPPRPPISPITPTNGPSYPPPPHDQPPELDLNHVGAAAAAPPAPGQAPGQAPGRAPGRAAGHPLLLSHATHPARVPSIPHPPPQPLDFNDNVDVIALKSAISTLQMQSRRAAEDIRTLRDVKAEALQRPEAFARHIAGMAGGSGGGAPAPTAANVSSSSSSGSGGDDAPAPEWPRLPDRIPVARCPPINWSQYAVNGQALDALHSEQMARPVEGAPATFSDGVYSHSTAGGRQEEYLGPALPYDPQRDKVARKAKGKK